MSRRSGHRRSRIGSKDRSRIRRSIEREMGPGCHYGPDHAGPMTLDHILPLARGGTNSVTNLVFACDPCNSSKGADIGICCCPKCAAALSIPEEECA